MTRQRAWQIRKKAEGRCVICGRTPLETGYHCSRHAAAVRVIRNRNAEKRRRMRGTLTRAGAPK